MPLNLTQYLIQLLVSSGSPLLNLPSTLLNLALKLGNLLESLLLLFLILLLLHSSATNSFTLKLVGTTLSNVARSVVTEELLEGDLDEPAGTVVDNHDGNHVCLELIGERNKLHTRVDIREELKGAGESQTRDTDDSVEHTLVLRKRLAEGTTLVVDGKCGDLLDELEEVDSRVKQRRGEFSLEINILGATVNVSFLCQCTSDLWELTEQVCRKGERCRLK